MSTQEIMEKIWRQIEPTVFISRREFVDSLEGCDVAAREIDGEVVGATIIDGSEFHFVSFGKRKAFPPKMIADCLQPIIERHGFVTTSTPKSDLRQRRFNERIGFHADFDDEYFTYFRMERLNMHGGATCRS